MKATLKSPRRRPTRLNVNPLEDRDTPAAVAITYTDIDGDLVKITANKLGQAAPPLSKANLMLSGVTDGKLIKLDLTDPAFDGARVIVTATKKPGGDGLVHVGFIDATGRDLDRVVVSGDLGKIVAGDAVTLNDPGLGLLQARSMGALGLLTGAPDLESSVHGRLGALNVARDFAGARLEAIGGANGQIGSVFIGGDLIGDASQFSGRIHSEGAMGNVRIDGDLIGGTASDSGGIWSEGTLGDVRVGGDVLCGSMPPSGFIVSMWTMGNVRIGGSVVGAFIASLGAMGDVQIGGDLIGGTSESSGLIGSEIALGNVRIGGDVVGGSITGTQSLEGSGLILSNGRIASVTIRGSLVAGTDNSTGTLKHSGAITAGDDIGPIKIRGSIVGNVSNPAVIIARGRVVKPALGYDVAVASLSVKGDVRYGQVLAGFNSKREPVNADASVGAVSVGGDWVASSIVAGAQNLGMDHATGGSGLDADNVSFGNAHDERQMANDTPLVSRIESIKIMGDVYGSSTADDHFGFVAQQVGALSIAGSPVLLAPGTGTDAVAIAFTDDVRVLEVS